MSSETTIRPPARTDSLVRLFVWLNVIVEAIIIGTGGAVRLTGSGLGCPTWPTCTADSLIPTDELSYHSAIEFGNRLMTGVVGIVAIITVVLIWRRFRNRTDMIALAVIVVAGVAVQGLLGGGLVLLGLHPNLVGVHYVISLALVCVAAALVARAYVVDAPRARAVPKWFMITAHITTLFVAVVVTFGIITTGAGPYSGDDTAVRNGLDAELWEHIHAWPSYGLLALTIVLVFASLRLQLPTARWAVLLLCAELVQIALGLYQARNGLPILSVGAHMVLASVTAAITTVLILSMKQPAINRETD